MCEQVTITYFSKRQSNKSIIKSLCLSLSPEIYQGVSSNAAELLAMAFKFANQKRNLEEEISLLPRFYSWKRFLTLFPIHPRRLNGVLENIVGYLSTMSQHGSKPADINLATIQIMPQYTAHFWRYIFVETEFLRFYEKL